MTDNVKTHKDICEELNKLYKDKNHDYGDSFQKSFDEWGMVMPCIRLDDKLNRLKTLIKSEAKVDESIDDTLMDIANYAIMTLISRRKADQYIVALYDTNTKPLLDQKPIGECHCKPL